MRRAAAGAATMGGGRWGSADRACPHAAGRRLADPLATNYKRSVPSSLASWRSKVPSTEPTESRRDDIGILQGQLGVRQQHLHCRPDLLGRTIVDCVEHPQRLRQHQMREPRALGNELLRGIELAPIIAHEQPHQQVRVNRAHGVGECAF